MEDRTWNSRATKEGGKIGDSAKKVAKILHPHFMKGKTTSGMAGAITMTDRLKDELPQMGKLK